MSVSPRGNSITKHMGEGGWLEGLSERHRNVYPKMAKLKNAKIIPLNILKVQSKRSKSSNLGRIFVFH